MNINITKLSNGLTVVTDRMPDVMTASIGVWVKVGSRYEQLKQNGISHFLEHMAFKGTKTRSALEIAESFENIGGYMNAGTGRENTIYYGKVLKDDIEIAVDIFADILLNSTFDAEELEKEKNVVLQEIAQTNDTPDDIIYDYHFEKAYENQAFGWSILGNEEKVKSFSQKDLFDYVDNHYSADRIIIAAAGNIKHDHIVKLVEKYFHNLKPTNKNHELEQAKYIGGACYHEKADLEQIHLVVGFSGLSYYDENHYTAQILANLLGGGMSSRLFQEIREKHALAYSVGSYHSSYSDSGMFNVYAGTTHEHTKEIIPLIFQEMYKVIDNITDEEIARNRAQTKASLLMSLESSSSRADHIGRCFTCYGRNITMEEVIEKVNNITKKDLQNLMQNILRTNKPTISVIGNLKNMPTYDSILQYIK